jgi:hypothetical protein
VFHQNLKPPVKAVENVLHKHACHPYWYSTDAENTTRLTLVPPKETEEIGYRETKNILSATVVTSSMPADKTYFLSRFSVSFEQQRECHSQNKTHGIAFLTCNKERRCQALEKASIVF